MSPPQAAYSCTLLQAPEPGHVNVNTACARHCDQLLTHLVIR